MDTPLLPLQSFYECFEAFCELNRIQEQLEGEIDIPVYPMDIFNFMWECFHELVQLYAEYQENLRMEDVLGRYYPEPHGQLRNEPLWQQLITNLCSFWYLTGETPHSFIALVHKVSGAVLNARGQVANINIGRPRHISLNDQMLMTLIWLRQYPTLESLGNFFHVRRQYAQTTIFHVLLILHQELFYREVTWHSPAH